MRLLLANSRRMLQDTSPAPQKDDEPLSDQELGLLLGLLIGLLALALVTAILLLLW